MFEAVAALSVSEPVQLSIISTLGGIVIAYITYVVAGKVKQTRDKRQPKDRMERMFDGYERLINQKDLEDQRKAQRIKELEAQVIKQAAENEAAREALSTTRNALAETREDLKQSRQENKELRDLLEKMRKEYKRIKDGSADGNDELIFL